MTQIHFTASRRGDVSRVGVVSFEQGGCENSPQSQLQATAGIEGRILCVEGTDLEVLDPSTVARAQTLFRACIACY
jgi:hypothetical protein